MIQVVEKSPHRGQTLNEKKNENEKLKEYEEVKNERIGVLCMEGKGSKSSPVA